MIRIAGILIKNKMRRKKKMIENHKLFLVFMCVGLISSIHYVLTENIWCLVPNIKYVSVILMIYLGAKIINPTQETIIDYQLIELRLISRREFKIMLGMKMYGIGLIIALMNNLILNEKIILIFALLNCSVNTFVFLRSLTSLPILNLLMLIGVCICMYLKSLTGAVLLFIFMTGIFIRVQMMHYDVLLPMYRMIYRINLRFTGEVFTDTQNDEMLANVERLVGSKKSSTIKWCEECFESEYKFYWMKEIARISYDKEGLVLRLMVAVIICVSYFYLPKWYGNLAVLLNALISYEFCTVMFREDAKLSSYGFSTDCNCKKMFMTKLPVYYGICILIMLPELIILGQRFWIIFILAFLIPVLALVKIFLLPNLLKNKKTGKSGIL